MLTPTRRASLSPRSARVYELQRQASIRTEMGMRAGMRADEIQAEGFMRNVRDRLAEHRQRQEWENSKASREQSDERWEKMDANSLQDFIRSQREKEVSLAAHLRVVSQQEQEMAMAIKHEASEQAAASLETTSAFLMRHQEARLGAREGELGEGAAKLAAGRQAASTPLPQKEDNLQTRRDTRMKGYGARVEGLKKQKEILTHQRACLEEHTVSLKSLQHEGQSSTSHSEVELRLSEAQWNAYQSSVERISVVDQRSSMNSFHASISAGAGGGDRDGDKFQRHPSLGQLQMQLQEVSAGFEPPTFLIPTMNQK